MDFRRNNRWRNGTGHWIVPPLPDKFCGMVGATFQRATFSTELGSEVFLLLLEGEDPPPLAVPAIVKATVGIAMTDFGPLMWILWSISEGGKLLTSYEQFVNPLNRESEELLRDAATQAFLKVVMVNSSTGSVIDLVELDNCLIRQEYVDEMQHLSAQLDAVRLETVDFTQAVKQFMQDHSIQDLIDRE